MTIFKKSDTMPHEMNFKVRKIKQKKEKKVPFWIEKHILCGGSKIWFFVLGVGLLGSFVWAMGTINHVLNGNAFQPITNLSTDTNKHINIVFLGVAGEGNEGGNLTDSIMIASLNPKNPSASFLSLPRDLFVESDMGARRINEVYASAKYKYKDPQKGLSIVKEAISNFTNIDIHYGVVIDFHMFESLIDTLGGIDIFIPEDIEDPFYPDNNYGYTTFVIRKGLQTIDGRTALRYARSRKTSSDYDRARRQQDILLAIRKKAEDISLFTDMGKLKRFYDSITQNIITDISTTQMISLAKMALNIDYNNSVVAVLNDDQLKPGGYLYTPAKEFYGGRYVLLPEDLRETQLFMDLVLIHPEVLLENAQIEVLNGSRLPGKARESANRLKKLGFHVIDVGNFDSEMPIFTSFLHVYSPEKTPETIKILKKIFNTDKIMTISPEHKTASDITDIQVIIGTTE